MRAVDLSHDKVFWTTVAGFLLRLSLLIFIIYVVNDQISPYYITDDIKYETLARMYMKNASTVIDREYFEILTVGYAEFFWPWIMCITSYIFKTIYVGRFLNIFISSLCIPVLYRITLNISGNKKTALLSAMLFAFLPITFITPCFPIKDIMITFAFLFALDTFLMYQNNQKISLIRLIVCALLLVSIYFSRGAVTELMLILLMIFFLFKYIKEKDAVKLIIASIMILVLALLFGNAVFSEFILKIDQYSVDADSNVSILKINSIYDIYKLPFSYFFATLQPLNINLFKSLQNSSFWLNLLTYLNISIFPVAIGNFLYIFKKKKNNFFWICTTVLHCAAVIMSLGIFRHYLFLVPLLFINYSLYIEENEKVNFMISFIFSIMLLSGLFMLSLLMI